VRKVISNWAFAYLEAFLYLELVLSVASLLELEVRITFIPNMIY